MGIKILQETPHYYNIHDCDDVIGLKDEFTILVYKLCFRIMKV